MGTKASWRPGPPPAALRPPPRHLLRKGPASVTFSLSPEAGAGREAEAAARARSCSRRREPVEIHD